MIDDNIIKSSYGKEIKDGIVGSTITIEGFENLTDISSELATISSGIYGQDIRVAIYSLLQKAYVFVQPWVGTQEQYDAIDTKEQYRLYLIFEEIEGT
jgi:hypothetical protein